MLEDPKYPSSMSKHVGIEIECIVNSDKVDSIFMAIEKAGIGTNICFSNDGSIDCDEYNEEGAEFKVLGTEVEISKILAKLIPILKQHKARVNSSCGLHVHLDMRNRDAKTAFKRLYKHQELLYKMQPTFRRNSNYCRKITANGGNTHYDGISKYPLHSLRTLEVRMHHGTVDLADIVNWVDLLVRIVDNKSFLKRTHTYIKRKVEEAIEWDKFIAKGYAAGDGGSY